MITVTIKIITIEDAIITTQGMLLFSVVSFVDGMFVDFSLSCGVRISPEDIETSPAELSFSGSLYVDSKFVSGDVVSSFSEVISGGLQVIGSGVFVDIS